MTIDLHEDINVKPPRKPLNIKTFHVLFIGGIVLALMAFTSVWAMCFIAGVFEVYWTILPFIVTIILFAIGSFACLATASDEYDEWKKEEERKKRERR